MSVPGWPDRSYTLYVPASYKCTVPAPVVLALHGGGSNGEEMALVTCPGTVPLTPPGQPTAAGCLVAAANQRGFVTVFPDGNKNPLFPNQDNRTFNAGGGSGGYTCVSGYACSQSKDDVAYFKDLVVELGTVIHVDPKRIFATGISNGAAMSHRLACEMSTTIAAIAPVAGGNQLAAVSTCGAQRPVPVLSIHGDADPSWPFWGGPAGGVATGNMVAIPEGPAVAVGPSTLAGWRVHNGCNPTPSNKTLPDVDPGDGSTVEVLTYTGCSSGADVVLYRVAGGGHTWPGGWQYYPVAQVGPTNRDVNASEVMLDFFENHPMP